MVTTGREPLLPWGARRARRRAAMATPPQGAGARACYEASLRLALGRRDRVHSTAHLALAAACLDPGVAWLLDHLGVDRRALLADLAATFPARRKGHPRRRADILRRYQRRTGRAAVDGAALAGLMAPER
ncbi:hypothetical protein [Catenulispora subtropica]|uniref:Uncharacterized protein n=1 Tax=Catenulispora subtropica TaxID=450798 RepID=A0ABN2SWE1_9ACTN